MLYTQVKSLKKLFCKSTLFILHKRSSFASINKSIAELFFFNTPQVAKNIRKNTGHRTTASYN